MSATVIATVVKMMESLPDPVQERVAEHLREYIEDLREGWQWDTTFKKPHSQLKKTGRSSDGKIPPHSGDLSPKAYRYAE